MCEIEFRRIAYFFQMNRIHRSDNCLHLCRMAEDPCYSHGRLGYTILFTDLFQCLVELWIIGIVYKAAVKET